MKLYKVAVIACLAALLCVTPCFAANTEPSIQVDSFEEGSIYFTFTNARFTQYEGQRAFSIDVNATVTSMLLSKDVSFANIELLFYVKNGTTLTASAVKPILLNSHNLGRVVRMDPSGPILTASDATASASIKGVNLPKGAAHAGILLFILPDNAVFVHSIRYYGGNGSIREVPNQRLALDSLDQKVIWSAISSVGIPSQVQMRLLDIYLAMQAFEVMNGSLVSVW